MDSIVLHVASKRNAKLKRFFLVLIELRHVTFRSPGAVYADTSARALPHLGRRKASAERESEDKFH